MTTATRPVLSYSQANECAKHKQAITRAAQILDARIKPYTEILEARSIRLAIKDLNAKVEEAETFRRSLGPCAPYPRIDIDIPSLLKRIDDVFDAVYYDLHDLPREA